MKKPTQQELTSERHELLERLSDWLDTPMLVLGFVWLGLLIQELAYSLTPFWEQVGTVIWIIFILDFLLRFTLAPEKIPFLKHNWLTVISLFLPALRVFQNRAGAALSARSAGCTTGTGGWLHQSGNAGAGSQYESAGVRLRRVANAADDLRWCCRDVHV